MERGHDLYNGRKGGLRNMKRKSRTILFIRYGIVFLAIVGLFLQLSRPQILNAESPTKGKSLNAYPSTPEGVVEAFVKVSFEAININEIGDIGDIEERLQYTTFKVIPGFDVYPIARRYRVIKLKEDAKEARVKVEYECIGYLSGLDLLEIKEETVEEIYLLKKIKGLWKIVATDHPPYISIKTAIKLLEWGIETYKRETVRVKKMTGNIKVLEKFVNSSNWRK